VLLPTIFICCFCFAKHKQEHAREGYKHQGEEKRQDWLQGLGDAGADAAPSETRRIFNERRESSERAK
tara:strand:- start:537 stop:740 length:204 start_codon:yes stop_codon:yes gene_type:complete